MASASKYEIDWRREKLAKATGGAAATRLIIGIARAGYVFAGAASDNIQPFSGDIGSSSGMAMPLAGSVTKMQIQVQTNGLSGDSSLTLRKNEAATALSITIPAGTAGLFTVTGNVLYGAGDRLDFLLTRGGLTTEEIDIVSITVVYELL